MALQRPGDVQGSELSGMRSTCLLGFKEPLVLFSDSLLGRLSLCGSSREDASSVEVYFVCPVALALRCRAGHSMRPCTVVRL